MIGLGSDKKTWLLAVGWALSCQDLLYVGPVGLADVRSRKGPRAGHLISTKLKRKSTDFFIFTGFVEVEQCEIKDVKERKPDPESDLQLEL